MFFFVCQTILDVAKQRRESLWWVSEVGGKRFFQFIYAGCAAFSWFFVFLCFDCT